MILYSIYEPSVVFPDISYFNNNSTNKDYQEVLVNGVKVLAFKSGRDEMRVERILSTNPLHFLDTMLQPGTVIKN